MSLLEMVDRGIEMNEDARNAYGVSTLLALAITLVGYFTHSPMWPVGAGVTLFFLALTLHAEYLRRKLVKAKERVTAC